MVFNRVIAPNCSSRFSPSKPRFSALLRAKWAHEELWVTNARDSVPRTLTRWGGSCSRGWCPVETRTSAENSSGKGMTSVDGWARVSLFGVMKMTSQDDATLHMRPVFLLAASLRMLAHMLAPVAPAAGLQAWKPASGMDPSFVGSTPIQREVATRSMETRRCVKPGNQP